MKSLTVIIPTLCRDTLVRTLDSIAGQRLQEDDQILVCQDSWPGHASDMTPSAAMADTVRSYGPQFQFHQHDAGEGTWGNDQRNAMIPKATGDWVLFQDDDDIFVPGAFNTIRIMADRQEDKGDKSPMYFRFEGPNGTLFWRKAGEILRNHIGGHCIVAPRGPKLAAWGKGYTGDYEYVARTSMNFKDFGYWYPHILSMHKPKLGWVEATSLDQAEALRLIRNTCRETMTRNTAEIGEEEQKRWFTERDPSKVFPYLFYSSDQIIGSGLVTVRDDNLPWATVCVLKEFRNQHFGRMIFKALSYGFTLPVYAEIARGNVASLKACLAAGFEVDEASLRTTVLRSKTQDRPLEDQPR